MSPFVSHLFPSLRSAIPFCSRQTGRMLFLLYVLGAGSLVLTGCSSPPYTVSPTSGLPSPPQQVPGSNSYIGTQSPLNWALTIDDNQNAYSYQSLPAEGSTPATASGTFVPQNGFLNLGAAGLALEIPGAGAILRPGDNTTSPVVMVEQENCMALSGKQRYLLQGMINTTANSSPILIYRRGDFVASTTPDGKTWSFADAEYIDPNGNQLSLNYQGQNSPDSFTGTCTTDHGASSVSIDTSGAYKLPTAFRFGSAGMAIVDYETYTSALGFAQPLYPVSTKSLATASFRGFQVEYSSTAVTQPVSFGPAIDGSVALNGGIYANDDVTQQADSSDLFQFGPQSALINGLFANATMTVLDPNGGCPTHNVSLSDIGLTPNGIPTCRLHLSAMVGQISGKAVIVASGTDFTVPSSAPDIQFYLIQQ
ncbi:MAG TPA: hypothetical protein VKW78_04640 [Terriglobales bacterium]|nr:hypothetical protein [Terriglobales bacterium]